jgi:hypothetical protein
LVRDDFVIALPKIPSSSEFAGSEFSNNFSQWNCCILVYDMVYITTLPEKIIYLEISARISSTDFHLPIKETEI